MNRVAVSSSNVAEVGYDAGTKILEVAFIKGGIYQYFDVPISIYEGLFAAPSIGRYLDVNVKKVGYQFRKIVG